MKHIKANSQLNLFDYDFPKARKIKKTRSRTQVSESKLFEKVKKDLFMSLPNGQFTPGWGLKFKKLLKNELHRYDNTNNYVKEINFLKYINKRVYDEMLYKINNNILPHKEDWEIELDEDVKKLEDNVEIRKLRRAFKGYAESYNVSIINDKDPLLELNKIRSQISKHLESRLDELNGVK